MRQKDLLLFIGLFALFILVAAIYLFPVAWADYKSLTNFVFLLYPLLATIGGINAVKAYGIGNSHGKSFLFITAGLGCWLIGEGLWAIFQVFLHIDPYPSIADLFYLCAYPLLLIGIVREITSYKTAISTLRLLALSFLSILLNALVFSLIIFPTFTNHAPFLETLISRSYGVADLLLIVSMSYMLLLIVDFKAGRLFNAWLYMLIGMIFMLLGDIFFAIYSSQYEQVIPLYKQIDLLWIVSYSFFTIGLFEMKFIVRDVQCKIRQLI